MADEQQNQQPQQDAQQTEQAASSSSSSNNKALKIVLIVVGVLIVLGILATLAAGFLFKKAGESLFEAATDSQVEVTDDGVNVETDGGSFSSQAELPDEFPAEVPLFEPADITASTSQQREDSAHYRVTFNTDESPDEVTDFYEEELDSDGWKTTTTSTFNSTTNYRAEHEEDIEANVTISPVSGEDTQTRFSLVITQ